MGNLRNMQLRAEKDGGWGEKSLFHTGLRKQLALAKRHLSGKGKDTGCRGREEELGRGVQRLRETWLPRGG